MTSRRQARSIALQSLYELDCTTHKHEEVLARLACDDDISEELYSFITKLVEGVCQHRRQLDSVIEQHAPAFPVDQMASIERIILRIALFEILFSSDTPLRVVINEAVELAKRFGGDAAPRLVNGVLGSVADTDGQKTPSP